LAASDRQWRWTLALAGCCLVNPPLNLLLVPLSQHLWHNAALGAALAWLATEILEVVYGIVILRHVVGDRALGRIVIAACAAGATQAAVLWLTSALWPPVGQALGVAVYGLVAFALGALPREDVALLVETIMRKGRDRVVRAPVAVVE